MDTWSGWPPGILTGKVCKGTEGKREATALGFALATGVLALALGKTLGAAVDEELEARFGSGSGSKTVIQVKEGKVLLEPPNGRGEFLTASASKNLRHL